jgi:hypothetical protein
MKYQCIIVIGQHEAKLTLLIPEVIYRGKAKTAERKEAAEMPVCSCCLKNKRRKRDRCKHRNEPAGSSAAGIFIVRFEVLTAVTMKNGVFWNVTPRGSCKNRRFGVTWCLLHQALSSSETSVLTRANTA